MKKIRIVGTPEMQTGGKVRNNIPVYASQYPTAYDPYTGTIQMNPAQFSNPQVYPHEAYHELQDRMGTMSDRSKWSGPLQRPSIVNADDMKREYFNRQQSDMDSITNRFIAGRPEFQMSPRDIIQQGYSRGQQYREPWTMEGEATNYANSQVPQHKQEGGPIRNTPPFVQEQEPVMDSVYASGMMKSRMATSDAMGNPDTHRMVQNYPQQYTFTGREQIPQQFEHPPKGAIGSHYMGSYGNYAIPSIQKSGDSLRFNPKPRPSDKGAIKFNNEDDAEYFGEHYKQVAPMMRNWEQKQGGPVMMNTGKRKVRITPPAQETAVPQPLKYGGALPSGQYGYSQLDSRWNPTTYQGMAGVNPDPDPYARTGKVLPEVPVDEANAVLEKQEKVLGNFTPDGLPSLLNTNAGSHASGNDKAANLPVGSFVFSDTKSLKIKDPEVLKSFGATKPSTPAQLATKYDLQKFTKVISDPKSDVHSKKTAEMMIANYSKKLGDLADYQEAMKASMGKSDPQPQQRYGGTYADGGYTWNGMMPVQDNDNSVEGTTVTAKRPRDLHLPYSDPVQLPTQIQNSPNVFNPSVPPVALQPMDMQNTSTGDNLGSATTTYNPSPRFTAPTPDKWGIANSMLNLATIHKYPGYQAPINAVIPQTVFEDPTRQLAAIQESANIAGYNSALTGTGPRSRANIAAIQGQAADQSANVLGQTGNRNTQIANTANSQAADITNRLAQEQGNRLNKLYEQNVTSAQQYDNATREGRNDLTNQFTKAWQNRQGYDLMNKTSPYFYIDPVSGQRVFKTREAEAAFNSQVLGTGATGYSPGMAEKVNATYMELLKQPAYQSDHGKQEALKLAQRMHGLSEHETIAYGAPGALSKTKESGVYSGPTQQYGGTIKHKFGGMTNHQLKKFVNGGKVTL